MSYAIGVDIGGTFTDCVAVGADGSLTHAKTLSTHATHPGEGVLTGIALLAEAQGRSIEALLAETDRVSHGTTIGTNLVVERKGARVALITTCGHGDALSMMRGTGRVAGLSFEQAFSVHRTAKPAPLVPRERIVEVDERVDVVGRVLTPLDEQQVRRLLRELLDTHAIDGLAICLLWSLRNPTHEQRIAAIARELAPQLFISLSSEVAPQVGEYERTVATVLNSYIGPASTRYLATTASRLGELGLERDQFLIMQANGGVVPHAQAERVPFSTLDSGPTGGLAGTAVLARACGHRNVLATDMGGTSFDVGLVIDGQPVIGEERVIAQYTYRAPHLDVRSIACGGGSIARLDPVTRSLRVGPHSAGSNPGPVCYGRGGAEPTVTDADVVLGLLRADGFLDGRMALDAEGARSAIARLGEQVGLSPEETAAGIIRINNNAAAALIRQRTVEQGLDPRDFVIYAFGGAGPVHAFGYAQELGVREVVIPLANGASTYSAFGIAMSDVVRYFDLPCRLQLPLDIAQLLADLAVLERRAVDAMTAQGFAADAVTLERSVLLRYADQYMQSLPLPLPDGAPAASWNDDLKHRFGAEYMRLFGEGALVALQTIEMFTLRVRARVVVRRQADAALPLPAGRSAPVDERPVFWPEQMQWLNTAVWDGRKLCRDDEVAGPAVVELPHTTVAVAPGQCLTTHATGSLVLALS